MNRSSAANDYRRIVIDRRDFSLPCFTRAGVDTQYVERRHDACDISRNYDSPLKEIKRGTNSNTMTLVFQNIETIVEPW